MTRGRDHRLNRVAERVDTASVLKPGIDSHLATELAWCDAGQANEAGVTVKGAINDPVIQAVMRRSGVVSRSDAIERAVVALESACDQLDDAFRAAMPKHQRQRLAEQEPRCAGGDPSTWGDTECGDIVRSEERAYGTWYHESGLCDRHLKRKERHDRQVAA